NGYRVRPREKARGIGFPLHPDLSSGPSGHFLVSSAVPNCAASASASTRTTPPRPLSDRLLSGPQEGFFSLLLIFWCECVCTHVYVCVCVCVFVCVCLC